MMNIIFLILQKQLTKTDSRCSKMAVVIWFSRYGIVVDDSSTERSGAANMRLVLMFSPGRLEKSIMLRFLGGSTQKIGVMKCICLWMGSKFQTLCVMVAGRPLHQQTGSV